MSLWREMMLLNVIWFCLRFLNLSIHLKVCWCLCSCVISDYCIPASSKYIKTEIPIWKFTMLLEICKQYFDIISINILFNIINTNKVYSLYSLLLYKSMPQVTVAFSTLCLENFSRDRITEMSVNILQLSVQENLSVY